MNGQISLERKRLAKGEHDRKREIREIKLVLRGKKGTKEDTKKRGRERERERENGEIRLDIDRKRIE